MRIEEVRLWDRVKDGTAFRLRLMSGLFLAIVVFSQIERLMVAHDVNPNLILFSLLLSYTGAICGFGGYLMYRDVVTMQQQERQNHS